MKVFVLERSSFDQSDVVAVFDSSKKLFAYVNDVFRLEQKHKKPSWVPVNEYLRCRISGTDDYNSEWFYAKEWKLR